MLNYLLLSALILVFGIYSAVRIKRSGKKKIDGFIEIRGPLSLCAGKTPDLEPEMVSEFEERLTERGFDLLGIYNRDGEDSVILAVYANRNFSVYASFFIFFGRGGVFLTELMTQRYDEKILLTSASAPGPENIAGWVEHNRIDELSGTGGIGVLCSAEFINVFDRALSIHVARVVSDHKPGYAPYYATYENYAACRNYLTGLEKIAAAD